MDVHPVALVGPVLWGGTTIVLTNNGRTDHDEGEGAAGHPLADVLAAARLATSDIAVITNADQSITYLSDSFTAMTGYVLADLLGQNCRVLQGPGTDPSTTLRIREVLASEHVFEGQILNYRKDGSAFWTALKIVPMRVGSESATSHYVSVQRDITNKVAMLKQLEAQASHDHVTGLPNRVAAERAVDDAVRHVPDRHRTVAVGLIDLDDFRLVNNTHGHAAGDAVLQQWATRVVARLGDGDVLARMGGDEFLLILKSITAATVHRDLPQVMNRLHEAVEQPFTVNGHQLSIGMSLGIALVPEDGSDSQSILRSADEALYAAKDRRREDSSWWETAADARSNAPQSGAPDDVAGRLDLDVYRDAVTTGNILVHFQPVVDLRTGSIHLFEALARLQLPGGRVAPPDEFLPHLGPDSQRVLFERVLDTALETIAAWDRVGAHHHASVNLPPEILRDGTIAALVATRLRAHGIEPHRLGLELLESQSMDLESQRVALQDLARLGVGLAMDDLGSGYSSLQRLSSFPFSAIKLDRGLFLHVHDRPLETLSVMASLIQLGRDLGMDVVIEGLEDVSLTESAIILGAPLGQGYRFARPMAAEDCVPWSKAFELGLHRSPMQTPLGALAYHWQFARLAAPHPLELVRCPLTRFIEDTNTDHSTESQADHKHDKRSYVDEWHALQHGSEGMHPASSRLLIDWLTRQIHTPTDVA
jgi:diguanylate cyclase (GGDEF)-like protein/PAS domain S-box-containing protein